MSKQMIWPATILPAAALAAFALTALPLIAQEPPAPPPATPSAGKPAEAGFKVDFGAGRSVRIDCGTTEIAACLTAAMPVIDKVAAAPPVDSGMMGKHHGKHDRAGKGWKGEGRGMGMGKGTPPAPPAEGPAP